MKVIRLFALLFVSTATFAQFTNVTGTVIDPHNLPYANGTIVGLLSIPSGAGTPMISPNNPYVPPTQPTGLDVNGHFSVRLADNSLLTPSGTKWNFVVCSFQGTVLPAFGTGGQCFTLAAPITISGSTQDISTQLNAAAAALTFPFGGGTGLSCTPVTNYAVLVYNNIGTCAPSTSLLFGFYQPNATIPATNIVAAGGGSTRTAVGGFMALGPTSGNFGSFFSTNSAGTQFIFGALAGFSPLTVAADNASTPVNFAKFTATGSYGWEFTSGGDPQGSGSAAGFIVNAVASANGNSPGAADSFTTGNATGNDTTSHGGDYSITTGTNVTGTSNARGGDVTVQTGAGAGTGRGGNINLNVAAGGQVLCNGNPCFTGTLAAPSITTCSLCPVTFGNSNTTIISKSVTFPGTGCPCRVLVSYSLFLSVTNSGQDAAMVQDNSTLCSGSTCQMATAQTATTGSASAYGLFGSGFSPTTYANGTTVTFSVVAASTHVGSTTANAAVTPALTGAQNSNLNIAILGSQ